MINLQKNSDGTLNGGFVSITGGRYRIIIGGGNPPARPENNVCGGTNVACHNVTCPDSTNTSIPEEASCSNGHCVFTPVNPNQQLSSF